MFIKNFTTFINYYGKGRKIKLLFFLLLSLIAGFLEFLGIALIYPFILMIVKPDVVTSSTYYEMFFSNNDIMTSAFIIGAIVISMFILKNLFMIFSIYLQNKFSMNWKTYLNKVFMKYYLYSSYKNLLGTSPSEKIYNLTTLCCQALDGYIIRGLNLITNCIIVSMILMLLFIKFPLAATVTTIFVIVSMVVQNKFFKNKMSKISKELLEASTENNSKIIENINNLKELKILCAESYFYEEYSLIQQRLNMLMFKNSYYGSMPPYIIEILIVASLLILGAVISVQTLNDSSAMVASYAIVVAAIFRIAPALNRIQASVNAINVSLGFVAAMNEEYVKCRFDDIITPKDAGLKLKFNDKLRLSHIGFAYDEKPVIQDLSLDIKKGEFIGIIGLSGAGKSTLADIIMGLLPIEEGEIFLDETKLDSENFFALRKLVGYVPQQINILDGSFKENVAWAQKEADENRVIEVMKMAQLNEFTKKINSKVIIGSNGLSQGQKQRLAIARALYRNPELIILDEATSSLDVQIENEIIQTLNTLKGEKTIIAIAHRLSTLKSCDRLVYIKDGRLVDIGSFEELSAKHSEFENLIKLSGCYK